ncbi:MAG: gamma-glutamylcyclotransferase [Hyphomicrobiaceae bacterium]|nr:gamma-glutamylcyclotransferase [Hyphomicrobiaceae bacterium]
MTEKRAQEPGYDIGADAFRHVPQLSGRIHDPHTSKFRFLDFVDIDRRAKESNYPENWRRPDDERESTRRAILAEQPDEDVWVFAYGSLMWDPGFFFDEVRIGRIAGYERRFCLHLTGGRGSPDRPGLMAALDLGDLCDGVVFRIGADKVEHETAVLWRREMISYGYQPKSVDVSTAQGEVRAMTFVADHASQRYAGAVEIDEAAQKIAGAKGMMGSNIDYVLNLADQLDLLGLKDEHFAQLAAKTRKYGSA